MTDNLDLLFFPRSSQTDNFEGSDLFMAALAMDRFLDSHRNVDVYMEMLDIYWTAFTEGNVAAGVNLFRVFMKIQINAWRDGNRAEKDILRSKYLAVSNYLMSHMHPIVPYYDALARILMSEDKDADWDMMLRLAREGNEYAVTLCTWRANQENA